jgi:hypothetical protein
MLELLQIHEDLAVASETANDGLLRLAFARRYREIIGIQPARRHALESLLKDLTEFDTVDEVIEEVRHTFQGNGEASVFD